MAIITSKMSRHSSIWSTKTSATAALAVVATRLCLCSHAPFLASASAVKMAETPPLLVTHDLGETVEIYDPEIHPKYSFFATIISISDDRQKFDFFSFYDKSHHDDILACSILGTVDEALDEFNSVEETRPELLCSPAGDDETISGTIEEPADLMPCSVVGFSDVESFLVSVPVTFAGKDDVVVQMPVHRIRRVMSEDEMMSLRNEVVSIAQAKEEEERENLRGQTRASPASDYLYIGSYVEIYNEDSTVGTPAKVLQHHHREDQGESGYIHSITALDVFNERELSGIDVGLVHPYKEYRDGTEATCTLLGEDWPHSRQHVDCTVVGHRRVGEDDVDYDIEYKKSVTGRVLWRNMSERNVLTKATVPLERVQRKIPIKKEVVKKVEG